MLLFVNLQETLGFSPIWLILIVGLLVLFLLRQQQQKHSASSQASNYENYSQEPFNQPNYYPLDQKFLGHLYQPISPWTGRLILPPKEQRKAEEFVLFEVHNAPAEHQNLVGKIVNLQWQKEPEVTEYVEAVRKNVSFTQVTLESQKLGNLHPERLNHLLQAGPLESLAGARTQDDVTVSLHEPTVTGSEAATSLLITEEPVQITGRFYGLVTIIKRENLESDRFEVRHFNKTSKQFDGASEIIRLPQVRADRDGIPRATNQQIEESPFNPSGWYIYGAKDVEGIFVVQGIEPRALLRLEPDEVILGVESGLDYIKSQNWGETEKQKGNGKTVLLAPLAQQPQEALSSWQEGDRAIVIHLFGGIGGQKKDERGLFNLVTGHFAYGVATVVREPLSDELRFEIEYQQVYAHNPDGIISGAITWSSYMGDRQRGWLGNRPVSDILVKLESLTQDYDLNGTQLSPVAELKRQLQLMMARYRIGNGIGAAVVTPARSCVQDSNQALYAAIQQLEKKVRPTRRLEQLTALGEALEKQLTPLKIVRSDWRQNAETLVGAPPNQSKILNLMRGLASWRTLLPRRAHDELASLLLRHGAQLWFIRTNQVGGFDPDLVPYAPTTLFRSII